MIALVIPPQKYLNINTIQITTNDRPNQAKTNNALQLLYTKIKRGIIYYKIKDKGH